MAKDVSFGKKQVENVTILSERASDGQGNELVITDTGSAQVTAGIPKTFTQAVTVTAELYATGDNVGDKGTLTAAAAASGGSVRLNSIVLADHDGQEAEMDITFFNADPSGSALDDGDATNVVVADAAKVAEIVTISPAHYYDLGDVSIGLVKDLNMIITAVGSAILYYTITTRGTPTFTDTDHLDIIINLEQL